MPSTTYTDAPAVTVRRCGGLARRSTRESTQPPTTATSRFSAALAAERRRLALFGAARDWVLMPPAIHVDDELVLDAWTIEDAPKHRSFAEDELAARFLGWSVDEARAQPDSYYVAVVRRFADDWAAGSRLSFAVRALATGEALGAVELRPVGDAVEVSYLVARPHRGRGVAPRALNALLAWARRELGVTRALLSCRVDNIGSRRVAEKCGFTRVARDGDELRFVRQL